MGAAPTNKVRVVSLNYSGIFISPFQFYGVKNWKQLQKIGLIFENYLKRQYSDLKRTIDQNKKIDDPKYIPSEQEQYQRNNFKWQMSQLDKNIKYGRYCPLYLKQEATSNSNFYKDIQMYPGIKFENQQSQIDYLSHICRSEDELNKQESMSQNKQKQKQKEWKQCQLKTLQNRKQYQKSWQLSWESMQKTTPYKKIGYTARKLQKEMTKKFDFHCYRAIIEYLFNVRDHKIALWEGTQQFNEAFYYQFQQIVQQIKTKGLTSHKFVKIYVQFMDKYFLIIDVERKLMITTQKLHEGKKIDIINFQEGNSKLKQAFKKIDAFYTLGPTDDTQDQSLLIFRKDLPFIPPYYKQNFEEEQTAVNQLIKIITRTLKQSKSYTQFSKQKNKLLNAIQAHFKAQVFKIIQQKFIQYERIYTNSSQGQQQKKFKALCANLKRVVNLYLSNPLKQEMDKLLKPYQQFFIKYWQQKVQQFKEKQKKSQLSQAKGFLKGVKENGLLFFGQCFTATNFTFTRKNLVDKGNSSKSDIILGNIHLTSKQTANKMQAQVVGILVYQLFKKQYKFILGGDCNAYLTLDQKNDQRWLFNFVKKYQKQKNITKQKLQKLNMYIFPKHNKIYTTKKKRTILQVQTNKSNILKEVCIDQIISNLKIDNEESYAGEISCLGSKINRNKKFLPFQDHPYDHYVVQTYISLDRESNQPNSN